MNRAERRRQRKTEKRRTATYNLTSDQLQQAVKQESDKYIRAAYDDGFDAGINKALVLMWCLPLLVLREHFWQKSFPTRAKRFCEELFDLYSRWQDGETFNKIYGSTEASGSRKERIHNVGNR